MATNRDFETLLKNPFIHDLTENANRIRRNLIVVSVILIFFIVFELSIKETSFAGLGIKGLSSKELTFILTVFAFYNLIHFFFVSYSHVLEWRISLTGAELSHPTTGKFSDENLDYPDDPRQSTLMTFWMSIADQIAHAGNAKKEIKNTLDSLSSFVHANSDINNPTNAGNISQAVERLNRPLQDLNNKIETIEKLLLSARIPKSLDRFEKAFFYARKMQNLQFLVIEIGVPIIAGFVAIYLGAKSLAPDILAVVG